MVMNKKHYTLYRLKKKSYALVVCEQLKNKIHEVVNYNTQVLNTTI